MPIKTRQSMFLEMFPNATLTDDGVIKIKPCMIDFICPLDGRCCIDCTEEYWLAEEDAE